MNSVDFLFFDFETLSNIPAEAPIISFGAIAGNWSDEHTVESLRETGFYRNVEPLEQVTQLGLLPNPETITWWANQGESAQAVLKASKIPLRDTIEQFNEWCSKIGVTHKTTVYIRAPHFDYTIYENLLRKLNMDVYRPFSHWKVRDIRTAIDFIYGVDRGYPPNYKQVEADLNLTKHNAMDDTILDYMLMKDWFKFAE